MNTAEPVRELPPQKTVYKGVGVIRRFDVRADAVAHPDLFDSPMSKWVIAEVWSNVGFDIRVFPNIAEAERLASQLSVPFVCKVKQ